MKKLISMLLALVLAAAVLCGAALADEVPQPEGGKKFETDWAAQNVMAEIYYEEEGYRVSIVAQDFEHEEGTVWNYSCYYHGDEDALVSVSSYKVDFMMDETDPQGVMYDEPAYEGLDEEGMSAVFTIGEDGRLIWNDPHENAGEGLAFVNIGRFSGSWKNEEEEVDVEFTWSTEEGEFCYNVWIQRGLSTSDTFVIFLMNGVYNPETEKLECSGTAVTYRKNADGEYDAEEDGELYDAFFSRMEDGRILFETANGIELEEYFDNFG